MQKITLADISRFDFNLAVTFLALWEERNVSKAALRLSLSQSAVSSALARLREAAADQLFVRTRGGMQPTPRAIAMARDLQFGVSSIRSAFLPEAAFDPASSRQHFSLAMSDDFQIAVGPLIARRLAQEAPHVSVVFRQTNRHTVDAAFEAGEIDFAMVSRPFARSWLQQEVIGNSGYACLLDPSSSDVALPLSLADYLALPQVLVSFSGREGIVDQALRKIGLQRRVRVALTQFSALPTFLAGTRAVATLPSHAARSIASVSGLSACQVPLDLGSYPVSLLWNRATDNSWMRHIMKEAFEESITGMDTGFCGDARN